MKKVALMNLSLLILLLHPPILVKTMHASHSVIRVPQDYPTIQAAVDAANPQDTILVSSGTYYENIVIKKSLQLIGENKDTTTLIGARNGTIEVIRTNNVFIKGFTVKNNVTGVSTVFPIRLHCSNNSQIEDCNLIAVSAYSGVWLEWSHNNKIRRNNITNEGFYGVYLFDADNNTITENVIASKNGILFSTWCEHNTIASNRIITSNRTAFYLYGCSHNLVVRNSFVNMTRPVLSYNSTNVWDNGAEGNYWNNYEGFDMDGDGIGDSPYVIDGNNQDNHPLMNPYILGDCNHDGAVNMKDAEKLTIAWQSAEGDLNYNLCTDFNMDKIVNIEDAAIIGVNWQKTLPLNQEKLNSGSLRKDI